MTVALKPRFTRRVLLFVCLGLVVFVIYFYYFVGTVNIADEIKRTNLFYYASAFIAFLLCVLFSSLAWRSLLGSLGVKTRIQTALLFMLVGMFFDVIVPDPGWSGDLSKAYMLAKASGQDGGSIAASVAGQKVIAMGVTVLDLILGLALLARNYALPNTVLVFVVIVLSFTILSIVLLSYLSASVKATEKMLDWFIRAVSFMRRHHWDSSSFRLKARRVLNEFHESIRTLGADPKALVLPVAFSFLSWGFDVSIMFLTFTSLGYLVPVDKVLIVYALTGSLQAMGICLLGFTEIVMSGSYTVLSRGAIPLTVSLSATLLTRVITLWFKLAVAYVAFQWAGVAILLDKKQTGT
jgi:uncharacterized protein (TIRG00374 family)